MFKKQGQTALAIVFIILGIMLALQFKTQQRITAGGLPSRRLEDVTARLRDVEMDRERLLDEVFDLRQKLSEVTHESGLIQALEDELKKVKIVAGLVEVKGPGIVITLDDSKRVAHPGEDPNAFLIHDDDVLKVINELAAAGAEAMSVNGQRLIATTEIRCAGPTISINNTRVAPPITIMAIGDPEALESGLKMRGGILETLAFWGIDVKIKREAEIIVPAYKGSLKFNWAKPTS